MLDDVPYFDDGGFNDGHFNDGNSTVGYFSHVSAPPSLSGG